MIPQTDDARAIDAECQRDAEPSCCPFCDRCDDDPYCADCAAWDARWAAERARIDAEAADQVRHALTWETVQSVRALLADPAFPHADPDDVPF